MSNSFNGNLPGIVGLMSNFRRTEPALSALAEVILRPTDESVLTRGERELIFTCASLSNVCKFCSSVHKECAVAQMPAQAEAIEAIFKSPKAINQLGDKRLQTLCLLAAAVAISYGPDLRALLQTDDLGMIAMARKEGATDEQIHDTVLIASAACMYNRYVDSLSSEAPTDVNVYKAAAQGLVTNGYVTAIPGNTEPHSNS